MNRSLKPCSTTSWDVLNHKARGRVDSDRLSSLPDELLIQILSLLPTKFAAATCVSCTKLWRVFPFITALDFDINHCLLGRYAIELYPTFVRFVDTVLQSYRSKYLTRFRLHITIGAFWSVHARFGCGDDDGKQACLPNLKLEHLGAWMSFPLTFCGLRELDLCIYVNEPLYGDALPQLPRAIFTCETLEVLKLKVNVCIDQVVTMPSCRLPNLKRLLFATTSICDDDFLPKLVSSCPVLEDLTFELYSYNHVHHISIVSTSLRRLSLFMLKDDSVSYDNPYLVLIDTPNLEYFMYEDNLALEYSFSDMPWLVEANLMIYRFLEIGTVEDSFQQIVNLIRSVSNVQHLTLSHLMMREFDCAGEKVLYDQLPVFPNLKHLVLIRAFNFEYGWNKLILPLLNCSPVLETLVFEQGLCGYTINLFPQDEESLKLEQEWFKTACANPVPLCCRYHLKKIVVKCSTGGEWDLTIIHFFLRHALVLEELVVFLFDIEEFKKIYPDQIAFKNSLKNSLENLTRASVSCSFEVLYG